MGEEEEEVQEQEEQEEQEEQGVVVEDELFEEELEEDNVAHNEISIEESNGGEVTKIENSASEEVVRMKKLVSSCNSPATGEGVRSEEEVRGEEEVREVKCKRRPMEEVDINKFNYDVILAFISKAWSLVTAELEAPTSSPVIYYTS